MGLGLVGTQTPVNYKIQAKSYDYGLDEFDSASGDLADKYEDYIKGCAGKGRSILTPEEILQDDIFGQRIINTPVDDALANWREIDNKELADLDEYLQLGDRLRDGLKMSRVSPHSGCLLPVIRYRDTKRTVGLKVPIDRVLRPIEISSVVALPLSGIGGDIDVDITSTNFGKPIFYSVGEEEVHHSRIALLGNPKAPYFRAISKNLRDFYSTLARFHETLRRNGGYTFKTDFSEARQLVQAQYQAGTIQDPRSELERIAEIKARTAKANLKQNNVLVIGQKEEVNRHEAGNIDDHIDAVQQQSEQLCGAGMVLASRLFQIKKSGLGASNFQDVENNAQDLDSFRANTVDPALRKIDSIIAKAGEFEYSPNQWKWNNTKAEDMLLSLRGNNNELGSASEDAS